MTSPLNYLHVIRKHVSLLCDTHNRAFAQRNIFQPENLQAGSHEVCDVTMNDNRLPASKLRKWLMGNNELTLPSRASRQAANGVSSY